MNIQVICANTLQAKGRVECANQTLQDRLPKEMRLLKINTREAGNAYLPEFIADFNKRFADEPRSDVDAHRPLTTEDDPARILTWQETRTISKNLTVQFENIVYQIQNSNLVKSPLWLDFAAFVKVAIDLTDKLLCHSGWNYLILGLHGFKFGLLLTFMIGL